MPTLPEFIIIILALASAYSVRSYFGGGARVLARLWICAFYLIIWTSFGDYDTPLLATLSRWGLTMLFLADIVPALVAAWKRHRLGVKCPQMKS